MAVNKVTAGDEILIDLTQDTVTPEDVRTGVTFHMNNGEKMVGTYEINKHSASNGYTIKNKGLINKIISKNQILIDLTQDTVIPYDVRKGKTFHMKNGEYLIGLYEPPKYINGFQRISMWYSSKEMHDNEHNFIFVSSGGSDYNSFYVHNLRLTDTEYTLYIDVSYDSSLLKLSNNVLIGINYVCTSEPYNNLYPHNYVMAYIKNYDSNISTEPIIDFPTNGKILDPSDSPNPISINITAERFSNFVFEIKVPSVNDLNLTNEEKEAFKKIDIKLEINNVSIDNHILSQSTPYEIIDQTKDYNKMYNNIRTWWKYGEGCPCSEEKYPYYVIVKSVSRYCYVFLFKEPKMFHYGDFGSGSYNYFLYGSEWQGGCFIRYYMPQASTSGGFNNMNTNLTEIRTEFSDGESRYGYGIFEIEYCNYDVMVDGVLLKESTPIQM